MAPEEELPKLNETILVSLRNEEKLSRDQVVIHELGINWKTTSSHLAAEIEKKTIELTTTPGKKNGILHTLQGIQVDQNGKLNILVGRCTYAEYVVTDIQKPYMGKPFTDEEEQNRNPTRAIVLTSLIRTSDGQIVLGLRTSATSNSGIPRLGTIGGTFNADETSHPFDLIASEQHDELGLDPTTCDTKLAHISLHKELRRTLLVFETQTTLTAEQIQVQFAAHGNKDEHKRIFTIPESQLKEFLGRKNEYKFEEAAIGSILASYA